MTLRRNELWIALLGSAALTAPAFAESEPAPMANACEEGFYTADSNADGTVTADEMEKTARGAFDQFDADGSGDVTRAEFTECGNAGEGLTSIESDRSPANMRRYDANADGYIDREEFMQAVAEAGQALRSGEVEEVNDAVIESGADSGADGGTDTEMAQDDGTETRPAGAGAKTTVQNDAQQAASGEPVIVLRRFLFIPASAPQTDPRAMTQDERAARAAINFHALDYDYDGKIEADEWAEESSVKNDMSEILNAEFDAADRDGSGSLSREEFMADAERRRQEAERMAEDSGDATDVGAPVVYFRYPHVM